MRTLRILLPLLLIVSVLAACASEPKKPSEEGVLVDKALALIEGVRQGYSSRDFVTIGQYTTDELRKKIKSQSTGFTSVDLEITPRWVDVEPQEHSRIKKVTVRALWKGNWKIGEKNYEEQGNATFVLDGDPLLIQSVEGNSPFTHPLQLQ